MSAEVQQGDERRGDEPSPVRHLLELGYVDPQDAAAAEAERRRRREDQLRQAVELIGQGRSSDAGELLDQLTLGEPDWTSPRQLRAEMQFRAGDWSALAATLDWLACHNVVMPRLAMMSATLSLHRRDLRAALEDLEYAAFVDPALPGVHWLLGTVQLRLGRCEAAKQAFRRALRRNRTDARAHDGLAALALRRRAFDDAAHRALEALEHDMQLAPAHYHLGVALVRLGRPQPAANAFAACARLDPSRAAPFYWLARVAQALGDPAAAAGHRARARAIIRDRRRGRRGSAGGTSTPNMPS